MLGVSQFGTSDPHGEALDEDRELRQVGFLGRVQNLRRCCLSDVLAQD